MRSKRSAWHSTLYDKQQITRWGANHSDLLNTEAIVSEETQVRAVVIDPNPLFYEGISHYLSRSGHLVLAQAPNIEIGLRQVRSLSPNLVMLGPHLAQEESLSFCREIAGRWPGIKIIVVTRQAKDALFQADAAYSGAAACLPADVSEQECLSAIKAVMRGHLLFSRDILSQAFQPISLTEREREVLRLLAEGRTDREVADRLKLAVSTVRNHSQRILEKLGVHSRVEAIRRARRRGWV
jgi:DNA-binding NarL/FixJ family response regulator